MLLGNTTCCALVFSSSSSVLCVYTTFSKGVEVVAVLVHRAASPTLLSLTVGGILHRKLQCGNVDLFTLDIQYIFNQYWPKASTCTLLFNFALSIIPGKTKNSRNSFK